MAKLAAPLPPPPKPPQLTSHDRVCIAAGAIVSVRTVERIYDGKRSLVTTRERVRQAAEALGLPLPPEGEPESSQRAELEVA